MGMITGGLVALGAEPRFQSDLGDTWDRIAFNIAMGTFMAVCLNGASNGINQVADKKNDSINKPHRVIPSGKVSRIEGIFISLFFWLLALLLSYVISIQCFWIVAAASFFIFNYSLAPLRLKARTFLSNLAIALPRGFLLPVAAWSTVKTIELVEPWFIGGIFFLFILGAATTKDFSDIKGDRAAGCKTLPVRFGVKKSVYIISPFLVLPFLLLPVFSFFGFLTGNSLVLWVISILLAGWGTFVIRRLLRENENILSQTNHSSWTHMYMMMALLQWGMALAYLL